MALLQISKLTIRFGGLCAVNRVDLEVPEGSIASIIGPNGAGKTTVFNCVTAIYEPTEGRIGFRGSDMRLRLRPAVVLACLTVGLGTALAAGFLSINVDRVWRQTVKANYVDASHPFPARKAARDLGRYLRGEPRLEERGHRWHVVTYNAERSLGSSPDRQLAMRKFAATRDMIALDGSDRTVSERQGAWLVLSADGTRTLAAFDSRDEAVEKLRSLAEAGREGRAVSLRFRIAALFGFLLGSLGAFSVWRQSRRTPHVVAAHGLARTFQNIRLFQEMSVIANVLVGMHRHLAPRTNPIRRFAAPLALAASALALALLERRAALPDALHAAWAALTVAGVGAWVVITGRRGSLTGEEREIEGAARRRARELLDFVGLSERAGDAARNLPYGDQRRLEIARALATEPALLLLDEPAAGMNPSETAELMRLIRRIRETGVTVLLIEHHMKVVMGISDRIAVLDYGTKIAEGTPEEVRTNPRVIEAYLGKEEVG